MQGADVYIDSGRCLEVANYEWAAREMQDVLSHRLPSLHRSAYRLLRNAADAEDAVQDALLMAYKHLDQFRGQSQMSTWLTAIVCNSARMHLRRRRHMQVSLDDPIGIDHESPLSEQLPSPRPSPEDDCQRSEINRHLARAAARLTPTLRTTLQLRAVEGLSTLETAKVLGVASGTVKAQLSRARAKMRGVLSQRKIRRRRTAAPSGI